MWVIREKKWMDEPELSAYINKLTEERDSYKQELTNTLRRVADHMESCPCPKDCDNCPHFWQNECPEDDFAREITERWWELHDKS